MNLLRIINKFKSILSKHQKLRILELAVLMIIGGVLEMCSVSLILPFMDAAINPEKIMGKRSVISICNILGISSAREFLVAVAILLAAIYLAKNAYLLLEYNIQYRFVYGNMFEMQKKLLDNFIHRPYEDFLKVNSGEMVRIVSVDTPTAFHLLSQVLAFITEAVVSAMMIITVFVIAPDITIIIGITLLVLLAVINQVIKPVLHKAGTENQASAAGMNQWLLQSIEGIKEIKAMMCENFFEKNFETHGQKYVRTIRIDKVAELMPRFLIEASSMSVMFLVLAYMLSGGSDLEAMIPMISAAAMAAVRLLPSVNRISGYLSSIAYGEPMLDKLIESLNDIRREKKASLQADIQSGDENISGRHPMQFTQTLCFHDVTYHYPGIDSNVLEGVNMTVRKGESIGIAGESGSGKTTVIDILLGLLEPQRGSVLIDGNNIRDNLYAWLGQAGYIPQMIFMLNASIRENVAFGILREAVSDEKVWEALEEASLADFVKSLPHGLDTQIGERGMRISGGQRQRIGIARVLYRNPEVLIFDEATSALDNHTESLIMESVNRLYGKKTIIIIAHRLTTIESCDHIYRVKEGKIIKER